MLKVGVITASDKGARGEREDALALADPPHDGGVPTLVAGDGDAAADHR